MFIRPVASTGTVNEHPRRVDLTCAVMSSGPSSTCSNRVWCHSSGTIRFSAASKSPLTVGSAFSFIVSDADVCLMSRLASPGLAPGFRRFLVGLNASSTSSWTKWHPRLGARMVTLRVHRTSSDASTRVATTWHGSAPSPHSHR